MAGNIATGGSLGTWIAGRATRNRDLALDGLFLGVLGAALYSLGNRLALASLDHAERVRWTGDDESDADLGIGTAEMFEGERLPQATPGMVAEEGIVQSPRPMSHVRSGNLGA